MNVPAQASRARNAAALSAVLLAVGARLSPPLERAGPMAQSPNASDSQGGAPASSCVRCHTGIEDMHPGQNLSCTDCHGGNATADKQRDAHVQPQRTPPGDERVAGREDDLAWRRFVNPMDLRVAATTCGTCHEDIVKHVEMSLHGTTAGHLSDGYYEMGLQKEKGSTFSVFPVPAGAAKPGDVESLAQIPPHNDRLPRDALAGHFSDLTRKECVQCHLWSTGRAVRGRVGFDGDYRGEGCAACHVRYALDGLSQSADPRVSKTEPGHAKLHAMTRAPTTQTCTSCHYGDASIGLSFRGLSQLPPGAPGGPDIAGTTDALLNRVFYLDDPSIVPPDVHHERGMACIDCHTQSDVMGDGTLYGAMERAVEISCSDCHGTFTQPATLRTARGTPLEHLAMENGEVFLTSKVDGVRRRVPQAVQVLDSKRSEFNPRAKLAMTAEHEKLECYACHASWNVNFIGFHFDRNESLTQLDLLSGKRSAGRVTTQEKVFATWKSFFAGLNESGRVAPYLTGFSTMGSVRDKAGELIVDQALPETAARLSGATMIHHQTHTNRPTARSCVECHRSSATWGMGSANFRLTRQLAVVGDRRGLEVVALDRAQLPASIPLAKLVLPDIVDVELDCDPLQGHARRAFVAEGGRGVHSIDLSDPTQPKRLAFLATIEPHGLALAGDYLYVADGIGGLRIVDVRDPKKLALVATLPMFGAQAVAVQWPYAYVADGPGGLAIVDVRAPIAPRLAGGLHLSWDDRPDGAIAVSVLFQYSRPKVIFDRPADDRTEARLLCAVLDERTGLALCDVTEPSLARKLWPPQHQGTRARGRDEVRHRGLALLSHVDLAEPQGGTPTREGDYAYVLTERTLQGNNRRSTVAVFDVSDPFDAKLLGATEAGNATEMLIPAQIYNPPFLQTVVFAVGEEGVFATDATVSAEPKQLGALGALQRAYAMAVEEFPFDRMLDEADRRLKDVSHRESRWLNLPEIERVLSVDGERLGTIRADSARTPIPGLTARKHLETLDADRSCMLEPEEYTAAAGAWMDKNGDGRITLSELTEEAGLTGTDRNTSASSPAASPRFLATRVDENGDLARLFDGIDPHSFDANSDGMLEPSETARALLAALDLDADKLLDQDELSRHPGDWRQLRYGGKWAREKLAAIDDDKDGRIAARELEVDPKDWEALDVDKNGFLQLPPKALLSNELRGIDVAPSEWPTRQPKRSALPPLISSERLLAALDTDKDGVLSGRELRSRPDLLREMDGTSDSRAEKMEQQVSLDLVISEGVDVTLDDFKHRWDLDGDGKVEPVELPGMSGALLRRLGVVK
jgi:hypothetical protein